MAAAAMTNVGKGFLWFVFAWMALNAIGIFGECEVLCCWPVFTRSGS
jgi:hypothetical protein